MESAAILEKIDSSPWVSNMVDDPKSDGDIQLCLCSRAVMTAITHELYQLPTIEELGKLFAGGSKFTKSNLKAG